MISIITFYNPYLQVFVSIPNLTLSPSTSSTFEFSFIFLSLSIPSFKNVPYLAPSSVSVTCGRACIFFWKTSLLSEKHSWNNQFFYKQILALLWNSSIWYMQNFQFGQFMFIQQMILLHNKFPWTSNTCCIHTYTKIYKNLPAENTKVRYSQ